jgi:hypothetical protein
MMSREVRAAGLFDCHREQEFGNSRTGELSMFKLPAYDPIAITIMGLGILLTLALAFVF